MPIATAEPSKVKYFWGNKGVAEFIDRPDPPNEQPLLPAQRNIFVLVNLQSGALQLLNPHDLNNAVKAAKVLIEKQQIKESGVGKSVGQKMPDQVLFYQVVVNLNWSPLESPNEPLTAGAESGN